MVEPSLSDCPHIRPCDPRALLLLIVVPPTQPETRKPRQERPLQRHPPP